MNAKTVTEIFSCTIKQLPLISSLLSPLRHAYLIQYRKLITDERGKSENHSEICLRPYAHHTNMFEYVRNMLPVGKFTLGLYVFSMSFH